MTFSKVASGILMFKLLDLAWAYGWTVMPAGFDGRILIVLTIGWLAVSGAIWSLFVWFGRIALRNRLDSE